jgi:hypothetical protein
MDAFLLQFLIFFYFIAYCLFFASIIIRLEMTTELEYSRALNKRAWSILGKRLAPFTVTLSLAFAYAKHCDAHEKARATMFYNRSKLFGGAKNPQY